MSDEAVHMGMESTYQCPTCHCDILSQNQLTHDAICARRQASANQRPAQPQIIRRESSSGGLADPVEPNYLNRRPQVREDRALVNNKLITCPNCEKSVREQNFNSHVANECEGNDKIPCEFCDKAVSMSSYTQHVEDTHRREREQEQERHQQRQQQQQEDERQIRQEQEQQEQQERQRQQEERQRQQQQQQRPRSTERVASPARGMASRQNVQENRNQGMPQERAGSADRNPPQENSGGFMGFLKTLVTAATQNRSEPNERPEPVEQPQPRSIFSRLAGLGDHEEHPVEQPQPRSLLSRLAGFGDHEEHARPRPMTMEDLFLRAIQGGQNSQRSNASQNPFLSQRPSGGRSTRTIRFGPHGTLVISNGRNVQEEEEPEDVWQSVGVPQQRQSDINMGPMADMGPMGLLLQMLASRGQGVPMGFGLNQEQMTQLEQKGLSKEDVESLSIVKYDAEKNKNLSEDMKSCPICLDEFEDGVEVRFLWCLHRFHRKCIDQWLEKHTNCPICKKDFSEMNEQPTD